MKSNNCLTTHTDPEQLRQLIFFMIGSTQELFCYNPRSNIT